MTNPLCLAPFHSITVNPDKNIVPCCVWTGNSLGNLNDNIEVDRIRQQDYLVNIRDQMLRNEWPQECTKCGWREAETGTSVRLNVYQNKIKSYDRRHNIRYLEYNSTNTCNLACLMCNPSWSSGWVDFVKKTNIMNIPIKQQSQAMPEWTIHGVNRQIAEQFVNTTDLSELEVIWFKGGEPFLNKEINVILQHLRDINRLSLVDIFVTTNCTILNTNMLALLEEARSLVIVCSVDAIGDLNEYIRFSPYHDNRAKIDTITKNILEYSKLKNVVNLSPSPAVQVYNIFNLAAYSDWWFESFYNEHCVRTSRPIYTHFLLEPKYCNLKVLSTSTRQQLARYYTTINQYNQYTKVIEFLQHDYLGDEQHNNWVEYTKKIDATRTKTLLEIEPRFASELVMR